MKRSAADLGARLSDLGGRYGLPGGSADRLERVLRTLEAEVDPPTTMRDAAEAVDAHVADSLVALEIDAVRAARRVADIGAGAGFPGLPLACALPETRMDLVESGRRKVEVIGRLIDAAGLANARAIQARAETWAGGEAAESYDAVTARALAPLPVVVEYAAPLLMEGGTVVVWRGARDQGEERTAADAAAELGLRSSGVLAVEPFAGAHSRHLHPFVKVRPTPPRFPRRAGVAAKRPLGRS